MALHCAATLVLAPPGTAAQDVAGAGAVVVGPLAPEAAVIEELQSLADLHRGERVVVPVGHDQLAEVLDHLGRAHDPSNHPVVLEIGDDGWALLPTLA